MTIARHRARMLSSAWFELFVTMIGTLFELLLLLTSRVDWHKSLRSEGVWTVPRLGNISREAFELGTAQSDVTTRIQVLEGEPGISLFEHHARGVTPRAPAKLYSSRTGE